ncbi:MAG: hypothetical protein HYZ28_07200 [Myxococcales bacterium]|nr:hypothetical protein [Myxococcales bacterium]
MLAALCLAMSLPASAQEPAQHQPSEVTVGIYVNQIHEVSLRENYFTADLYLWFRWKDDALKPHETFALQNGRVESQIGPVTKKLPDGSNYAYVRLVAKVTKFWDITEYPLDDHRLPIAIEEDQSEDHLIRYVADTVNSGSHPTISVPGWNMVKNDTESGVGVYRSNFGDISLPTGNESSYTRLTTTLHLSRQGTLYFMKLFFGLWVSAAIAFLAFFIKPSDVDPRFGLGVGAIFAAIASEYIVTSSLPDTNIITLADKLHIVAFAFIFASIGQSTWSLYLFENEQETRSKWHDRLSRLVFPLTYVVANALVIALR